MRTINKKFIPPADCRVPTSSELPESKRENEYAAGSDDELAALQQRALLELGAADGGGQRRHARTACYFFDHLLNLLLTCIYTYDLFPFIIFVRPISSSMHVSLDLSVLDSSTPLAFPLMKRKVN